MNMWNELHSLSTVICRKDGAWKACVWDTDKKKKKKKKKMKKKEKEKKKKPLDKVTRSGSNRMKTCTALWMSMCVYACLLIMM